MFEVIRDWFNTDIIGVLNTTVTTDLAETSRGIDPVKLPANQKDYSYTLRLEESNEAESNSRADFYNVNAVCELSFQIINKDTDTYESLIDTYVHPIVRLLKRFSESVNTDGYSWNEVNYQSIKAGNLNRYDNGYFKPTIEFSLYVCDSVVLDLAVPSAPTLTSPANNYSNGLLNQPFNWTGTADTWNFVLLSGTTELINQTGLVSSSFTIPADNLLTDGQTYTWKVKGKNTAGWGAWSSTYTFTVSDNPMPAVPVLDLPLDGATGTGSTTFMWSTSDNAETYDIQISTDVGFSTTLVDETGLTASYYAYTFTSSNTYFWRVRAVNGYGTSDWTDSRNVVEILPVPDYRTGLVAEWLATSGVTSDENGVSAWVDTISSRSATQSTTANKPFCCANQKNGLPVIRFTTNRWLTFSSLALTNFTVIIGYKASSFQAGNSNYLLAGSGKGIFSAINALSIGYGEFDGTRIRAVTYNGSDTTWHIRSFQNQKLYSNGTEPTYSGYAQNLTGMTLTTIGTRSDNTGLYFSGDIAFIRVYDSVLSTTNRAIAETYLNSIWGVY